MENSMHGSCPAYVSEWSGGSPVQYAHSLVFDGNGRQRIFLEAGCFLRLSHGDAGPGYAAAQVPGHQAWRAVYEVKQPGVYQFAMEPAPYFDPEEDRFIIHYTKTVVAAFGDEKGWAAISSRAVCCWTVNLSPVPRWKWNTIIMESIA